MIIKIKKFLSIFCIFIILFGILHLYSKVIENKVLESIREPDEIMQISSELEITNKENANETKITEEEISNEEELNNGNNILGEIIIPKVDLVADVKEGVEKEIIDNYVGHFEDTSNNEGNIGLAAHNRGINVKAYFSKIKNLQKNDIIIYKTNEIERTYEVETIDIIEDTDFSYLDQTEDNRITLITCVNNEPNYRLCVQAIEQI